MRRTLVVEPEGTTALCPVIVALREKALEPGMSLTKVAARLDTSPSYISGLAYDRTRLNVRFLQAVAREFPDLRPLVIKYITEGEEEE